MNHELFETVPHGPLAHPQSMKSQWGGRPCPPHKTAQVENLCHRKTFSGQMAPENESGLTFT